MRVNDKSVLDFLNNFIVKERLNKSQIIQLADIAIVSNDIRDLEENLNGNHIFANIKFKLKRFDFDFPFFLINNIEEKLLKKFLSIINLKYS